MVRRAHAERGAVNGSTVRTTDGTVAIVTGAGRGIGAACALRLAAAGARVAAVDRTEPDTKQTVADIETVGGEAVGMGCDVADADQVTETLDRVLDGFGRVDVLVNCAGVTRDHFLLTMDEEDWDQVVDVNLGGSMNWSLAAGRVMRRQGYGRIVLFGSVAAQGNPGQANYSAAKGALSGFARSLASELGPYGVTVNCVAPGFVATPMVDELVERLGTDRETFLVEAAARTAVGRVGSAGDLAAVVSFLTSTDAGYLAGQTVTVDGGRR